MSTFYAPSTRGFYSRAIHGKAIPQDAVEITPDQHAALLAGLNAGQVAVVVDGVVTLAAPPPSVRSPAEITAALTAAVQAHVDAAARSRGYNDGASCASYAPSTVPAWAAEAVAFVAWRDEVWSSTLATLAAVTAGTASVPTAAELIAGLPVIAWPID